MPLTRSDALRDLEQALETYLDRELEHYKQAVLRANYAENTMDARTQQADFFVRWLKRHAHLPVKH